MANFKTFKFAPILILIVSTFFLAGCGGGGGGGGSNPVAPGTDVNPNAVQAPGTNVLAGDGAMYSYPAAPAANIALKVPVDAQPARYALVVTNPNTSSQNIKIRPESYVLGDAKANLTATPVITDYDQLLLNQAQLESRLRLLANQRGAANGAKALRSLRAADNSGEKLGDIVVMRVVADWWGNTYVSRNCKLVRISNNCKIFLDQDEYNGLSAVTGSDRVTEADLDHFVSEYENHIHNLITNSYGNFYDIDNDGKVSILLSPVYTKLGFAGLFNSNDFTTGTNSNQRDLIALFTPEAAKNWSGERWREATRETICHEMQHLVNYSANFYFNNVNQMEEEWLDESLSVGAEARYRLLRGSPILENRFNLWAQDPSGVGIINFNRFLAQYGMVGLFNFFLYEQSDDATIKAMVNSSQLGKANLDNLFAGKGGMNGIFRNWAMAAMIDALRGKGLVDAAIINADFKYKTSIGLNLKYTEVPFGFSSQTISVPAYGAAFYLLNKPAGFTADEYQFRIESESGKVIDILMVRLP